MTEIQDKNLELFYRVNPMLKNLLPTFQGGNWEWCETDKKEKNLKRDIKGHPMYLYSQAGAMDEVTRWFLSNINPSCKAWFIFGLGLGYHYQVLKNWLKKDPSRFLIFIEDDLEVIQKFLSLEEAFDILNDPQVIVRYFCLPKEDFSLFRKQFDSLISGFFHHSPSLGALDSYRLYRPDILNALTQMINLSWAELNMTYQGITILSFSEDFANFYRSFPYIHKSYFLEKMNGLFPNIPVIMCGAGPSLQLSLNLIRQLEDKAIIAGAGSSLNALSAHGIIPHFGGGVDPSIAQRSRFLSNNAYEVPIAYFSRFNHQAFQIVKGPKLFVKGLIGFPAPFWFEKKLKIFSGFYETNFGISTPTFLTTRLTRLGTKQVILCGMDLSYPTNKRYSPGIEAHPTDTLEEKQFFHSVHKDVIQAKNALGENVNTTLQMKYESSFYSEFANAHPDISVINTTLTGLEIFNIPHQSLDTIEFPRSYDLMGRIHAAIQNAKFNFGFKEVKEALDEWKTSFENCKKIGEKYLKLLQETTIEEFEKEWNFSKDFSKEPAFTHVLTVYLLVLEPDFFLDQYQADCHPERFTKEELEAKKRFYHKKRLDYLIRSCEWHIKEITKGLLDYADKQMQLQTFSRPSLRKPPKHEPQQHSLPSIDASNNVVETVNEVDGNWEGEYRVYYPSGKLFGVSHYKKGQLHGSSKFYDENKNLMSETEFVDGRRHGEIWFYYPSGEVYSIQRFDMGVRQGIQEYYYQNNVLKTLINYDKGILDGEVRIFHENGAREREMTFVKGKLDGFEYAWAANETLIHESQYSMGTPINKSKVWDENGKLIQQYAYHGSSGLYDLTEWDSSGKVIRNEVHVADDAIENIKAKSADLTRSIEELKAELERLKKGKK